MKGVSGPRFAEAPAMLLAGIRRHHTLADATSTIPAQWQDFRSLGLRDSRAPRAFGVMCGWMGDEFEYMTALEVEDFDHVPPSLGRMRVPPQSYAVFLHEGHVSSTGSTWQMILDEWLPGANYVDAETPAFELYDQRFDAETGNGGFEIWFPIKRK